MATIDIRTIKVLLDTNIPNKEIMPLTKSILYQPQMNTGKWNEYPFFTMDAEYPELYLSTFTYEQQMEFFFIKQKMIEILRTKSNITEKPNSIELKTQYQITKEAKSSSEKALEKMKLEKEQMMKFTDEKEKKDIVGLTETKDSQLRVLESNTINTKSGYPLDSKESKKISRFEYEKERNRIGEKNIMIMIRLMFPTKYPLVGNNFSSFNSVVTGKNEFNLKWTDFIPSFFKKKVFEGIKDYSYLKIDGTIYTVTQAIWLNDIYNHKEYKQLINKFEELQRWKDKEILKNNNELMKRYKLFQQTYRTGIYKLNRDDIENIRKTLEINAPEQEKSYITTDRLNKYKTIVNGLIKALEQFLLVIQSETINKHAMIDNSTKFVELMTELRDSQDYRAWFRLENQERFDRIRRKMKEDLDNIKTDEYIFEMYLKHPGINMDYEKDTKHKPIIDQKYSTYTRFVDNIRKFRAPVLESSNIDLQNTIEDFLNNTEKVKNVFIFLMNPINVKKNPFSELVTKTTGKEADELREEAINYQNRLNTGITIRSSTQEGESYYEVYIQVNVIGGEVNDDNKSTVDCMYEGENLGDKLARLLNEALYLPWTMNNSRIFFDITTGEAKSQIDKEKVEKEQKDEPKKKTSTEKKMGGKTRKYREWLMKTQKRYITR